MKIKEKELSLKIYRQYKNMRYVQLLTFVLIFTSVMFFQSGCSLFGYFKIERYIGTNSICWEDNDHILIYASIAQYHDFLTVGGSDRMYDWVGGEIWRITASTGAKELLFRSKDGYHIDNARMYIVNGNVYISGGSTAKVREDFSGWDNIGDFIYPIVSSDEIYIVGVETSDLKTIKQYDESGSTVKVLYVNDELITWLDYDFERNYLLINSNKFVDLNTGEEVVVVPNGEIIDGYYVVGNAAYGKIWDEFITTEVWVSDTLDYTYIIKVEINNPTNKSILTNIQGVSNPSKDRYAYYSHSRIIVTDTLGNEISETAFSDTEL